MFVKAICGHVVAIILIEFAIDNEFGGY